MSLDLRAISITDEFQEVLAVPQIWRLLLAVSLRRDTVKRQKLVPPNLKKQASC